MLRRVALDSYAGQTIRIRFRAAQGSAYYGDHWYLDDVRIGEREPLPDLGFPFADDMEGGSNNWEPGGQWALVTDTAYSGVYAWDVNPGDEYQRYTDFAVELGGLITIPADALQPQLSYYGLLDLALNTTAYVDVTTGDGQTWTTMATYTGDDNDPAQSYRPAGLAAPVAGLPQALAAQPASDSLPVSSPAPRVQSAGVVTTTRVITYTYDPLNRLTSATYSTGERFECAYDAVGNWLAMTETITPTVVTTYTCNAANQLLTARASDDSITWHYTHDQRGNLVRQTPGGTEPAEGETRHT